MLKNHFWTLFGLIALLIIGAAFAYSNHVSKAANEGVVTASEHIKGNPEATVTLVEYSDFQCPACAAASGIVAEVLAEHGDNLRFEYKHFPLVSIHPHAVLAARAAEAAGQQGKFFEMHDALFKNQTSWSPSGSPQVFFNQYAEEIGLDMEKFKTHMRASVLRDEVMNGYNEARDMGLTGTPSFFLNGEKMTFVTYEEFADQVRVAVNGETSTSTEASADVPLQAESLDAVEFGI